MNMIEYAPPPKKNPKCLVIQLGDRFKRSSFKNEALIWELRLEINKLSESKVFSP